MSIKGDIV